MQPIIIVGSTISVHDFVPSFRAPKVHFELPPAFAIARCSRHSRGETLLKILGAKWAPKFWNLGATSIFSPGDYWKL